MKYSTRNTIHSTFGVLQSSLNHKVVFCLPTLLFKKTFANKNVLDVVAKPMFTFSKHVFLRVPLKQDLFWQPIHQLGRTVVLLCEELCSRELYAE